MVYLQCWLEWIQLWHAQRTSQTSLQILGNWYLSVFSKDLLFSYWRLFVFVVQSQHFAVFFPIFCVVFQLSSFHFALNYLLFFANTMNTYRKLQNAVTIPKIQIKPNKKTNKTFEKTNKPNFSGSGDCWQTIEDIWACHSSIRSSSH